MLTYIETDIVEIVDESFTKDGYYFCRNEDFHGPYASVEEAKNAADEYIKEIN